MTVATPVSIPRDCDLINYHPFHHRKVTFLDCIPFITGFIQYQGSLSSHYLQSEGSLLQLCAVASPSLLSFFLPSTTVNHFRLNKSAFAALRLQHLILLVVRLFSSLCIASGAPFFTPFLTLIQDNLPFNLTKIFHHDLHQSHVRHASAQGGREHRILATP